MDKIKKILSLLVESSEKEISPIILDAQSMGGYYPPEQTERFDKAVEMAKEILKDE